MKLKKKKILKNKITLIIFSMLILLIMLINYIGHTLTPIIIKYAEKQAKKVATTVIIQAVDDKVLEKNKNIFSETNNGIDYDTNKINKLLEQISKNVRNYLKELEQGNIEIPYINNEKLKNGVIYEVPTGIIFNNGLLANIGPKIPVKLNLIGDIVTDITTNIKEYGINNALLEIGIKVKVTEEVVLPFSKNEITVEANFPLIMKIIKGEVPKYYASPYTLSS